MSRIDFIGQNGNEGIHYEEIGETYHEKIKRIAGEPTDDDVCNDCTDSDCHSDCTETDKDS